MFGPGGIWSSRTPPSAQRPPTPRQVLEAPVEPARRDRYAASRGAMKRSEIDVWYMPHQILCNFSCAYCSTAGVRGDRMWGTDDGAQMYRRIIERIAALPRAIRPRVGTAGEPFVSK